MWEGKTYMKLCKLKKFVQEKHGWWDTKKVKSYREVPSGFDQDYWTTTKTPDRKFVFRPFYYSTMHHAWRKAP